MPSKNKQNDSVEEDRELKELKRGAKITAFTLGHFECVFDLSRCIDICNRRHHYYDRDKKPPLDFPPKYFILSGANTKIETFLTYLRNLKTQEGFFYITSLDHMFMDIQDLFLSIFRRMEGILNLSYEFGSSNFSDRIKNLNLSSKMEENLGKLTTLRNKLIHAYGYAKPWINPDKKLKKLTDEGIHDICFNSDPKQKLIAENDPDNIGKWVNLIEILLGIVSSINKTPNTFEK